MCRDLHEDAILMYQRILIAVVVTLVVMFVAYVLLLGKP
jgi:hypothetical protein